MGRGGPETFGIDAITSLEYRVKQRCPRANELVFRLLTEAVTRHVRAVTSCPSIDYEHQPAGVGPMCSTLNARKPNSFNACAIDGGFHTVRAGRYSHWKNVMLVVERPSAGRAGATEGPPQVDMGAVRRLATDVNGRSPYGIHISELAMAVAIYGLDLDKLQTDGIIRVQNTARSGYFKICIIERPTR